MPETSNYVDHIVDEKNNKAYELGDINIPEAPEDGDFVLVYKNGKIYWKGK